MSRQPQESHGFPDQAVDDPYSFIRASDMLVNPSQAEGQPPVLLEAMVLETPILATSVSGVLRTVLCTIDHGVRGRLVEPDGEAALGEALLSMAEASLKPRCKGPGSL